MPLCFVALRLSHGEGSAAAELRATQLEQVMASARKVRCASSRLSRVSDAVPSSSAPPRILNVAFYAFSLPPSVSFRAPQVAAKQEATHGPSEQLTGVTDLPDPLDAFAHVFAFGDFGSKVDAAKLPRANERAKAAGIGGGEGGADNGDGLRRAMACVRGGPGGWAALAAADELSCGLEVSLDGAGASGSVSVSAEGASGSVARLGKTVKGFAAPGCDQFPPIADGATSSAVSVWAPHYGPRCLVRSRGAAAGLVVCREFGLLDGDPTTDSAVEPSVDRTASGAADAPVASAGTAELGAAAAAKRPRPCPQRPLRAAFTVATH